MESSQGVGFDKIEDSLKRRWSEHRLPDASTRLAEISLSGIVKRDRGQTQFEMR